MATLYDKDYRLSARDAATALVLIERLNPILRSLDLRVGGVEERSASIAELEAALRAYGMDRINTVLAPVVDAITAAAGLGALLTATSASAQEVSLGVHEFLIPAPARGVFAPSAVLSAVADDDASAVMLGRRLAWSAETGLLTLDVFSANGGGAHPSWTLSAAASAENAGQVRTAPVGVLGGATLAAQLAEIAAVLDQLQPLAATLSALAGLSLVGGRAIVTDEGGGAALTPLTAVGRAMLAAADKAAAREAIDALPVTSPQILGAPTVPTSPVTADSNRIANVTMVRAAVAALADAAPAALDTLRELATALGNDANFATTVTNQLALKQPAHPNLSALAGLVLGNDKMMYATGAGALGTMAAPAYGRSLVGSASALAALDGLGPVFGGTAPVPSAAGVGLADGDFNNVLVPGVYTVAGAWSNGPAGAGAITYVGVLEVRARTFGGYWQQTVYLSTGAVWSRYATGDGTAWPNAWERVDAERTTCEIVSFASDGVWSLSFGSATYGWLLLSPFTPSRPGALCTFCGSNVILLAKSAAGTVNTYGGVLSGATGAVGGLNLSCNAGGAIYIENRTGASTSYLIHCVRGVR